MKDEKRDILLNGTLDEKLDLIEGHKLTSGHIDLVLDQRNDRVIDELIYTQKMTTGQHLRILQSDDPQLLMDRIEMYADEQSLPTEVVDIIIKDEKYRTARSVLVSTYYISQRNIEIVLRKETDFWEIVSIIEQQGLRDDLIEYIYDIKVDEVEVSPRERRKPQEMILEYLIYNQPLPDTIIEDIINKNEKIYDLINGQRLSNKWILHILGDMDLENYHYEIIRMQTIDEQVADFIYEMRYKSPYYSLVRLQKLSERHIELALNTGYESMIVGVLESQEFSEEKQEELVKRFPEHEKLIRTPLTSHSSFWSLFNKRHRRDGKHRRKLENIF